jgi:hypothetical protein
MPSLLVNARTVAVVAPYPSLTTEITCVASPTPTSRFGSTRSAWRDGAACEAVAGATRVISALRAAQVSRRVLIALLV